MPESYRRPMSAADQPSDDTLIAAIAAGDRDAFAAFYRRRRPDVYRFAFHVSGSPAVADDVTQDVFMAVMHHARPLSRRPGGRRAVAAGDHAQSRAPRPRSPAADRVRCPTPRPNRRGSWRWNRIPLAGIARRNHAAVLRQAVVALPVKFREAVVSLRPAGAELRRRGGGAPVRGRDGAVAPASRARAARRAPSRRPTSAVSDTGRQVDPMNSSSEQELIAALKRDGAGH